MYRNVAHLAGRVLVIGVPVDAPIGGASSPADALAPDGMLIVMEGDVGRTESARRYLEATGLTARANVISGDPQRMLYKLAGPFDIIFCDTSYLSARPIIERLLAPSGVLITNDPS